MNIIQHLKQKKNKKGFTLAELLIVIAILAILVAIAVPVFTSQLAKAKAATDAANLRSAISFATNELLTNSEKYDGKADVGIIANELEAAAEASMGKINPQSGDGELTLVVESASGDLVVSVEKSTLAGLKLEELRNKAGQATASPKPTT